MHDTGIRYVNIELKKLDTAVSKELSHSRIVWAIVKFASAVPRISEVRKYFRDFQA